MVLALRAAVQTNRLELRRYTFMFDCLAKVPDMPTGKERSFLQKVPERADSRMQKRMMLKAYLPQNTYKN